MQRFIPIIILLFFVEIKSFAQEKLPVSKTGIYLGVSIGTWFPDNKNKVLGNPSLFGVALDLKNKKQAFGITFDLIGFPYGKTTKPIQIKHDNEILTRNEFFGGQFVLEYSYELWSKGAFLIEGCGGIGYGRLSYYNPDKDIDIGKSSPILNPGISFRYLIGKTLFIQLKTQYYIANYDLNDNVSTSFKGNFLTTKLIFGSR